MLFRSFANCESETGADDGENGEQNNEDDDQSLHRLFLADDDMTGRPGRAAGDPEFVRKRVRFPDRPPPLFCRSRFAAASSSVRVLIHEGAPKYISGCDFLQ